MLKFFEIIFFKRQDLKKLQGRKKIPKLVKIQKLITSSQSTMLRVGSQSFKTFLSFNF
jgi:hypothetical protein